MTIAITPFVAGMWQRVDNLIDHGAGYDDQLLEKYGTARDFKRRRNIGRAIIMSTIVGGLGWFFKLYLSIDGLSALGVAASVSAVYMVIAYSVESFFAGEVDPFAPLWKKVGALFLRAILALFIALFAALPWASYALRAPIALELTHMQAEQQRDLRDKVDAANGTVALSQKGAALKRDVGEIDAALRVLPDVIIDQAQLATACSGDLDRMIDGNRKKAAVWTARLPAIAAIEAARTSTPAQLAGAERERSRIRAAVTRLLQEVESKKGECAKLKAQADEAKTRYIAEMTGKKALAERTLAAHAQEALEVEAKVKVSYQQVAKVVGDTVRVNTGVEFEAMLRVIAGNLYARLIVVGIVLGLWLIDTLPLALRIFARPGAYDAERRTDEAIRLMAAETRFMEADLAHSVRREEIRNQELRDAVRGDARADLRDVILSFFKGRTGTAGAH